ncbi:amidohydrolase family protein [Shewanella mangrovi]|uniref:amidohydrolase family protein n=1 Tax=Shewanella mangrovi TaxID=1515746 RepID=UPI00068F64BB|nr:amidohydrolase family protein [Shewanella mangrovi]
MRLNTLGLVVIAACGYYAHTAMAQLEQFSVIANGENVGYITADTEQGHSYVTYYVDNNGRGPKHKARLSVNAQGIPQQLSIKGTSLMGGEVAESFSWQQQAVKWTSQADTGELHVSSPALYIANDGDPWLLGRYASAILQSGQQQLPTLPAGNAYLTKLRSVTLGEGQQQIALQAYMLSGLSLSPSLLLLDEQQQLFAVFSAQEVNVRKGYEAEATTLQQLASTLESERMRQLQQQLAHRFTAGWRLDNVHLFSPETGTRSDLVSITVSNGKIAAITPMAQTAKVGGELAVYDGEGGTVIPGLHDMHSHSTLSSGLWYLAAGVTNTRDMGNDNQFLLDLIPQIDAGELAGPRITRNGFLEGRSPYSARDGFVVNSQAEALAKVRWYKEHGYWQIKIYNSMNPEWVPAIAKEAHRLGMSVTGHIPAFTDADHMIAAGYNEITHINQLMLGWLLTPDEDTRTPLRLTAMTRAATLDLSSAKVQHTLKLMQQGNIGIDPTAVILERLMLSRAGEIAAGDQAYLSHMPIGYQRYRQRSFVTLTPELDNAYRAAFDKILAVLKLMHDDHIRIFPGTDDTTGFTLLRELELYVKAGISPAEVLSLATLGCAQYLGNDDRLGSVAIGKQADFVLLADDPLKDISAVRTTRLVAKDQQFYFPSEIYQALGVTPFSQPPKKQQ